MLGVTGIAHLLEHMAFKGSQRIGTRDYSAEAPLLAAVDEGAIPCCNLWPSCCAQ